MPVNTTNYVCLYSSKDVQVFSPQAYSTTTNTKRENFSYLICKTISNRFAENCKFHLLLFLADILIIWTPSAEWHKKIKLSAFRIHSVIHLSTTHQQQHYTVDSTNLAPRTCACRFLFVCAWVNCMSVRFNSVISSTLCYSSSTAVSFARQLLMSHLSFARNSRKN